MQHPAFGPGAALSPTLLKGCTSMMSDQLGKLEPLLSALWEKSGSDLLLSAGTEPRIRVDGALRPVDGTEVMKGDEIDEIVSGLLNPEQQATFDEQQDVDFAFSWGERARLRASAFTQNSTTALSLRMIPKQIPTFDQLGLPPATHNLAKLPRGFVLVTGPTGSGKTTTLASIIDKINDTRSVHILTLEDPVEFVHKHKLSAVSQREIGVDSPSFDRALRSALREDPDVLLLGEMRDLESIQIALTMAETGHLVFATLHTNDAAQAVDRIIDVFPAWQQEQIRIQLSGSLAAIIAQRILPKEQGGMVAAFEVLIANSAVRNLIREGKSNQLQNVMLTSQPDGMVTLETSLARLVEAGTVSYEEAMLTSGRPKELARLLGHTQPKISAIA